VKLFCAFCGLQLEPNWRCCTGCGTRRPQHQLTKQQVALALSLPIPLAKAERILILRTLELTQNDKKEAASLLGISLKTLYNKLRALEKIPVAAE
jgi:DNA-binding NtrC family response regulator